MRTDKLTSKFQLALADAQSLAVGREHQFVEPIHLMTALIEQDGSTVRGLLTKAGVNAIYGGDFCTYTDTERFYSSRREATCGRMATLIWLSPPRPTPR